MFITGLSWLPLVLKTDQTAPKKRMFSSVVASSSQPMITLPLPAMPTPVLSVAVLFNDALVFTSKEIVRGVNPLASGVPIAATSYILADTTRLKVAGLFKLSQMIAT